MVLFAAISLITALFGDVLSLLLAIGLGVIAFNELRGAAGLRRLDPRAPRLLGRNQITLGLLIVAYAGWSLFAALRNPQLAALQSTGDADTDAMMASLTGTLTYGLYGGMAAAGVIAPGLTAWYYFSRARHVRAVLETTPGWVLEVLRAAG